jgi:hypothetical protein
MKMRLTLAVPFICFCTIAWSVPVSAQAGSGAGTSSGQQQTTPPQQQQPSQPSQPKMMSPNVANVQPGEAYHRPTEKEKLRSWAFVSFGPYAFVGSAAAAGVQQADNAAPEWGQGADAYGVRVANNFGINLVTQTTRYGLAAVFHEDTLFYRCECDGFVPRLKHALISTITARRGDDGHRTFSFSSLVAPYAGGEVAALGWYPSRYDAKDGFRIGNYNLAVQAGLNVALEFIYGGPHTFLGKHHVPVLSNATGSQQQQ